jgi:hypothetical protein
MAEHKWSTSQRRFLSMLTCQYFVISLCALNLEISANFSYFEARLRVVAQEEPQMEAVTTMIS